MPADQAQAERAAIVAPDMRAHARERAARFEATITMQDTVIANVSPVVILHMPAPDIRNRDDLIAAGCRAVDDKAVNHQPQQTPCHACKNGSSDAA